MDFDDLIDNPGFWILGGGGVAMEILGWIFSKKWIGTSFPLWQLGIMVLVTLAAAAYFSTKD